MPLVVQDLEVDPAPQRRIDGGLRLDEIAVERRGDVGKVLGLPDAILALVDLGPDRISDDHLGVFGKLHAVAAQKVE
jgi:hypothetical protein